MHNIFRRAFTHPALALGSAVLWGLLEFMALQNARRTTRIPTSPSTPARGNSASINRARE